ncbi:hypothetical protein Scep_015286 [Stephania cephalantha]|uniref:Cytochrome P450 n=1 Tax=Stephania cephalantha TaxID=152367 RepID=A0AAP0J3Q2_9MAGN
MESCFQEISSRAWAVVVAVPPRDFNLPICISTVFFTFTLTFSLFSLLLYLLRISNLCCSCDACHSYLTSSWTLDFPNLSDFYTHLLRKSPSRTITLHSLNNVVTANPLNVLHILHSKFPNYPKGKPFSAILGDLLGRGIFNVDGPSWSFQRKLASLELSSSSVRLFALHVLSSEIHSRLLPLLLSKTSSSSSLDLQDVFKRFSFDNICKFSFGVDPGCLQLSLPVSEFADAFDLASRLSAERALCLSPLIWRIKRLLNVGCERRLREAIHMVDQLAREVIRQKRKSGSYTTHQDLLSRFMNSAIQDDDAYLRDIVISFLLAGRDTVASTLTTFFFSLANNPDLASAILAESDRVMGPDSDRAVPSPDQIRDMVYLHAAVHESMRLYPPVQFDSKFALEDDVLPDGTFVKKGTRVTYHPYAMGRMEEVWGPDCLEFRPDRWIKNGVFSAASPYEYPVFQAGLRVCLGKELALMEIKCVVVAVVRRFEIEAVEPRSVPLFAPGLTTTVQGGLPVRVRQRRR